MKIDEARFLKRIRFFPFYKKRQTYKYTAILSLGSNIEPECERFVKLVRKMIDDRRFAIEAISPLLVNEAFGYKPQRDFHNAIMIIKTNLHARALLKIMQHYEKIFKRVRSFKNAPRTLDIDIVYFSAKTYCDSRLILPHPGADKRISVWLLLGLM